MPVLSLPGSAMARAAVEAGLPAVAEAFAARGDDDDGSKPTRVRMTWSILVRDPATGAMGAAVATRFFAVGALAIHAEGGEAVSLLGHQVRILTDSAFARARIQEIDARAITSARLSQLNRS